MKNIPIFKHWACRFTLAGLSLVSLSAVAQDVENLDNGAATPAPQPEVNPGGSALLPITITAGGSEQLSTDIDKNNGFQGKFSLTRFKTGVVVPVRLGDSFTLGSSVRYEFDRYNFSDLSDGVPSPWRNINTLSASEILNWRMDDNWSYFAGALLRMSVESGASFGQGTTAGGLIGVNYKFDDTLTVGGGFAAMSQIEESGLFLPLVTAKWKFADDWRLEVGLTDVATAGYGADVKYDLNQNWTFSAGVQAHKSRFRIDQQSGVGQESASTVYFDATWHASPKVDVGGFVGLAAGGKLRFDNSEGVKQFESDYKTAAILGLKASLKF